MSERRAFTLRDFVRESNRIEGIHYSGRQLAADIAAHEDFLSRDILTVPGICAFALRVTRGEGRLRNREGMDVRVGNHLPLRGGQRVEEALGHWLIANHAAYKGHVYFEQLHPLDRKSTRLNSSHPSISYAVFCLKKK